MNKTLLTLVLSLSCMITTAKDVVLTSPGGQVVVTLNDEGGKLSYNVRYQGAQILEDSPLGIVTDRLDLTKGLTIENATDPQTVERAYELRTIKQRHVSVAYRQAVLTVAGDGGKMEMEWMVSDVMWLIVTVCCLCAVVMRRWWPWSGVRPADSRCLKAPPPSSVRSRCR